MKRWILASAITLSIVALLSVQPVVAKRFTAFGKPLNLFGFASQSLQVSLKGDRYHVEQYTQQALMNLFLEGDYRPGHNLTFYASGLFTIDWVYDAKTTSWEEKLFSESRDELYVDDEYWQLLKELHVTWAPGDFLFRVGKQIVSWGEMDFLRIMDQINPIDDRRGFSDVEFETTVIPSWLLRAEYWQQVSTSWLEEVGLQFVFNPNADFIPNQDLTAGNAAAGIWSAAYLLDNPVFPFGLGTPKMYVGPLSEFIEEPETWDADEFEYGVRLSAMIRGSILTMNGFYGRENSPENLLIGFIPDPQFPPVLGIPLLDTASDGTSVIFPIYEGFFPRQKYVGVTWTQDIPVRVPFLGGVSPLLRLEARYQFDKVFTDQDETMYIESDFLDTGIGIDWKVKINALNPRAFFSVMPQFFFNRILDYPDGIQIFDRPDANYYAVTLYLATSYFNGKLVPEFAFLWDFNDRTHLILPSLTYIQTHNWSYSIEAAFIGGEIENRSLWLFRDNDYIAFKLKYNWG